MEFELAPELALITLFGLFMSVLFVGLYSNPVTAIMLVLFQCLLASIMFIPQVFGWTIVPVIIFIACILNN